MRTLSPPCLALVLALGLAGPAPAQDDARAVVEKAIKAQGGEEQLARAAAVRTRYKGTFVGLGAGTDVTLTGEDWQQPGSHRQSLVVTLGGQKSTLARTVHGGKGWEENDGAVKDLDADELEEGKHTQHVSRAISLVPLLKDKGVTLTALGKKKVDGAELLGVKAASAGYPDVTLYFDPTAGYLKRVECRDKSKAQGKEVTTAYAFDDYRVLDPAAVEEGALKAAKVGTDGPALLRFLRVQVRSPADRDKVQGLVKQLGDDSFEVRDKASQELIRMGAVATAELRRAAQSGDVETAMRARRCLEKIAGPSGSEGLLAAALALVAVKRPAGAVEVLLELAPSLSDEDDVRDLRSALAAVAVRDGKPDPAVEKALEDKDPARRGAAAAALGKDDGTFEKQAGRRLFPSGLKWAMKLTAYQDGEKQLVFDVTDVQFCNRFADKVFAKPK